MSPTPSDRPPDSTPIQHIDLPIDEQTADAIPELQETFPAALDTLSGTAPRLTIDRRSAVNIQQQHQYDMEIEDRRFRYWLIKVLILCFCLILLVMVGAMVYAFTTKGTTMSEPMLKNFMETLTEILKVLKPDKPG